MKTLEVAAHLKLIADDPPDIYEVIVPCGRVGLIDLMPVGEIASLFGARAQVDVALHAPVVYGGGGYGGAVLQHAAAPPVALRPAKAFPPGAGEWFRAAGEDAILVGCPKCGVFMAVAPDTHRVGPTAGGRGWTLWGADGKHTASIRCPRQGCDWHAFVKRLLGWGGEVVVVPFAAWARTVLAARDATGGTADGDEVLRLETAADTVSVTWSDLRRLVAAPEVKP